jgi:hypothetical protein
LCIFHNVFILSDTLDRTKRVEIRASYLQTIITFDRKTPIKIYYTNSKSSQWDKQSSKLFISNFRDLNALPHVWHAHWHSRCVCFATYTAPIAASSSPPFLMPTSKLIVEPKKAFVRKQTQLLILNSLALIEHFIFKWP